MDEKFVKRYGKRIAKYSAKSILTEYYLYHKDFNKKNDPDLYEVVLTGFSYLKEKNIFPFLKVSHFLKKDYTELISKDLHHPIFQKLIDAGKECLLTYGINFEDINNFYIFSELNEEYHKVDFINKIESEKWKHYFLNRNYLTKDFSTKKLKRGGIKDKYPVIDIFLKYKLQLNEIKSMKENNYDYFNCFLTGYVFLKEKDIFPFLKISQELNFDPIFLTTDYKHKKIPEKIIDLGKECLATYGINFEDVNNFYFYEKLKDNSFNLFLKKEIKDKKWQELFISKQFNSF